MERKCKGDGEEHGESLTHPSADFLGSDLQFCGVMIKCKYIETYRRVTMEMKEKALGLLKCFIKEKLKDDIDNLKKYSFWGILEDKGYT